MQDCPLTVTQLFEHGEALHSRVLLRVFDGHRVNGVPYGQVAERVRRLGGALQAAGILPGDRVGTLMWNTQPHLEAYFAAPCIGAVLHTVNPRLFPDQIGEILDDAEDSALLIDTSLWASMVGLVAARKSVQLVVLAGPGAAELAEASELPVPVVDYERFVESGGTAKFPTVDERSAASMCYTSGTTGKPKGVVYSHRSVYLHSMANCMASAFAIGERDRVLAVVPMFHANGWGFAYAAWLAGASLILPDRYVQADALTELIVSERPTVSGGVPTVWRGVLQHAESRNLDITSLRVVSCAGSAVPPSLIRDYDRLGIELLQAWGMTETSPLAAVARVPAWAAPEDTWDWRTKTGRPVPGVAVRLVDEDRHVLRPDGVSIGEFEVKGPWVTGSYYRGVGADRFHDGWLATGDVGTLDEYATMRITDRNKDLIKSGGEWISSVDLENALMNHPAVLEAAIIAVPDPRWEERPLAVVVLRGGAEATDEELRAHLAQTVARWQLPDRWVRLAVIPKTGVGKVDKVSLRQLHAAGKLTAAGSM